MISSERSVKRISIKRRRRGERERESELDGSNQNEEVILFSFFLLVLFFRLILFASNNRQVMNTVQQALALGVPHGQHPSTGTQSSAMHVPQGGPRRGPIRVHLQVFARGDSQRVASHPRGHYHHFPASAEAEGVDGRGEVW